MLSFSKIKCNLNINDQSYFSLALKVGKTASEFTTKKQIRDFLLKFNEVLTVPIDQKTFYDKDQMKQKVIVTFIQCEIMLYRFMNNQSRESKHLIGIGSFTITNDLLKQTGKTIKITNMLDNEAFVQCQIKITTLKSQHIFQLNESKISQTRSKSDSQSLNYLSQLEESTNKGEKTNSFSQCNVKNKNSSKIQIPQRLNQSSKVKQNNSFKQKAYSDLQSQKTHPNTQNKFLVMGVEKSYHEDQEMKKIDSSIIIQNDLLVTQKTLKNQQQNESFMQLCTNLQNQNNLLMIKIIQLQSTIKKSEENQRCKIKSQDNQKIDQQKRLSINQPISITYRPIITFIKSEQNLGKKQTPIYEAESPKTYSKFIGKNKYLALGVIKNKDSIKSLKNQNILRNEIATQTQTKTTQLYKLNINGINFQDYKQKSSTQTITTNDNESKTSSLRFTTFQPINLLFQQKYRKNQKLLKKYNEKLTQQVEKLKQQNKKLLQQISQKKFITLENYQQLQILCTNQESKINRLIQSIKQKDERIQQLQVKLIQIESQRMKVKDELKEQRKSIAYFLKSSHLIDQQYKQQSANFTKKQFQSENKVSKHDNFNNKVSLKKTNSKDLNKIVQRQLSSFDKFGQIRSQKNVNQSSYLTPINDKLFNSVVNSSSKQQKPDRNLTVIKTNQLNKFSQLKLNIGSVKNSSKRSQKHFSYQPKIQLSGLLGTGQTIFQGFGSQTDR